MAAASDLPVAGRRRRLAAAAGVKHAERAVLGLLPRDPMRQNAPVAVDERCRGFVAARFKAEDQSHYLARSFTRPFIGRASRSGAIEKAADDV